MAEREDGLAERDGAEFPCLCFAEGNCIFNCDGCLGKQVGVSGGDGDVVGLAVAVEDGVLHCVVEFLHSATVFGADVDSAILRNGARQQICLVRDAQKTHALSRVATVRPHDRVKNVPLAAFDSSALLRAVGIADGDGRVRASMRGKYDQVNEFLKVVKETIDPSAAPAEDGTFTVVDCGCGKAYLTFALYFYLVEVLKFPSVKVIGVDRRADVIESSRKTAAALDLAGKVEFVESDLAEFDLPRADMVVSLHACDTATDEALAKAVEWKARYVLSAPCCQHELHKSISAQGDFSGLLRHSILRERLCDLLTDAFRAMIMRILGFRTQVVEFVSAEATARNVMLKCEYGVKPGQSGPVSEYLALRDYWKVVPWLETRLSERLARHVERYS